MGDSVSDNEKCTVYQEEWMFVCQIDLRIQLNDFIKTLKKKSFLT